MKRDKQVIGVENASSRWALYLITYGLLIDAVYRKDVRNEPIWDLIALVGVGATISVVYLIRHKAMVSRWPWTWRRTVIVLAGCIVVAARIITLNVLLFLP